MAFAGLPAIETIESVSAGLLAAASGGYLALGGEKSKRHWRNFYQGLDISGVRRRPMPLQSSSYQQAHRHIIPYHMAPYRAPTRRYHYSSITSQRRKAYRRRQYRKAGKHTFRKQSVSRALVEKPSISSRIFQITRTYELTSLTYATASPDAADGGFGISFKLSDIGSYTDFTAMFQYYKILRCVVTVVPVQDTFPSLTAAQTQTARANGNDGLLAAVYDPVSEVPFVFIAADNGSDTGFTSKDEAFAHEGTIVHPFTNGKPLSVGVSPHVKRVAGTVGGEVEVHKPQKMWVSTADASEEHYGMRGYYQALNSGTKLRLFVKAKIAFKDLKT